MEEQKKIDKKPSNADIYRYFKSNPEVCKQISDEAMAFFSESLPFKRFEKLKKIRDSK